MDRMNRMKERGKGEMVKREEEKKKECFVCFFFPFTPFPFYPLPLSFILSILSIPV
jgi:hypothetical protein